MQEKQDMQKRWTVEQTIEEGGGGRQGVSVFPARSDRKGCGEEGGLIQSSPLCSMRPTESAGGIKDCEGLGKVGGNCLKEKMPSLVVPRVRSLSGTWDGG